MRPSSLSHPALRARLLAGCVAVLIGGLGLAVHPAAPHGDHHGAAACGVCVHLDVNPATAVVGPDLPAPGAAAAAPPARAAAAAPRTPAICCCRAPPALTVS